MFPPASNLRPKWPGMLLLWMLLALPAIAPLQGLGKDRNPYPNVPEPPPEPNPIDIEVPRSGGPVLITLSAYSLTSPIIRFRIRRPPEAGKLGIPKLVSASTAVVKYTPPAGAGPGEDSFVYAIQSYAGVSAPADVHIKITDADPILIASGDIEFGQVLPGRTVRRTLDVQNIGGGIADGAIEVPDGWTVEGDTDYHLTAGQKRTFTIVFTPTGVQNYTGDIAYSSDPDRATDLNGEGIAPLAVTTGSVALFGAPLTGTIHVENRTDTPATFTVTPGESLLADSTIAVPAKGSADIVVTAKSAGGPVDDSVTVEGPGIKAEVPVTANILPPSAAGMTPVPPGAVPEPATTPRARVAAQPATQSVAATSNDDLPALNPPPAADNPDSADSGPEIHVPSLGIGTVSGDEATVGCDFKNLPLAARYRLESESVALDAQGQPVPQWNPFQNADVQSKGSVAMADLQHLRPGALYVVRLVGLDGAGRVIEASSIGQVWTVAPGKRWGWWNVAVVGAIVAIAGVAAWSWLQRRRQSIQ